MRNWSTHFSSQRFFRPLFGDLSYILTRTNVRCIIRTLPSPLRGLILHSDIDEIVDIPQDNFRPLFGDLSYIHAGEDCYECKVDPSVPSSGTYLTFPIVAIVNFSYSFDTVCVGKEDKFHFYGHSPIKPHSIYGISVCAGNIKKSALRTFQIDTVFPHISYILTYEEKHPASHPRYYVNPFSLTIFYLLSL